MLRLRRYIQLTLVYATIVLTIAVYPLSAFAESAATYDPVTGRWNTSQWYFDPVSGQYQSVPVPDPVVPDPVVIEPVAPVIDSEQPLVSDTPLSEPVVESVVSADADVVVQNTVTNTQTANAVTGDAAVINNTQAGGATSGNASDTSTTLNLINASVGGDTTTPGVARFVSNISGDVIGDIYINPMIVSALTLQSAGNPVVGSQSNTTVDATTINAIANKINLNAASGNATVAGNTSAGGATSGNADAVANVMNIINSIVGANQSFIGTINIYGNLDGDILIAPDFIPQLLAGNIQPTVGGSVVANITDTQTIANIINLNATTGTASVVGNTTAGSATTGTAQTNIVILNLSGHQVIATNSLLVFVNVLGKWVGVIVDAPAGSTAAAIGSGVTKNDVTSQSLNATTNTLVTNDITINAASGDAAVIGNTQAGDATTGNATASANILNMTQSSFGLAGWFGVLFINVFGSWFGSFGVDTTNGTTDPVAATSVSPPPVVPAVFSFVPKPSQQSSFVAPSSTVTAQPAPDAITQTAVTASASLPLASTKPTPSPAAAANNPFVIMAIVAAVIGILGVAVRGGWSALIYRIRGLVSPR